MATKILSSFGMRDGFYARHGKRALDIFLALLALPVAAPLILAFYLLARMDHGPGLYHHQRVGRGGRLFDCWKVRTMVVDADARLREHIAADPRARAEWELTQKLRHDPRITRFGAFLRSTSLDELPQLWNILLGDMSFVGPRPFTPDQVHIYQGASYYALRPGLTGMWQVGARNEENFAARAMHDANYARRLSFWLDLTILAQTVGVVLRRTGR